MPITISCNQNVAISVIQGAYETWVSGQEAIAPLQELIQDREPEIKYVYYTVRTAPVAQLELFAEAIIDDKAEFQQLASKWRIERGTTSSTTEIVLCPSYQSIIGLGPKVVPLILAELESEGDHPDHWFWALQVLTKADPVSEEDEGNFRNMARSWLDWARKRYVW